MRRLLSLAVLLVVGAVIIRLQPDDGTRQDHDASTAPAAVATDAQREIAALAPEAGPETPGGTRWVTVDRLNRRSCPSTACGIVGTLYYREAVTILESRNGWARITDAYDAACAWGRSPFVETGNDRCNESNGIADGRLAEWVSAEFLAGERPPDPADGEQGTAALIAHSDDFRRHRDAFVEAAEALMARDICTPDDFIENGGFVRSTSFDAAAIYFTFCGGTTIASRFYLNATTGEVFQ